MTFPAGVAIAKKTGKPLIVHVHSLEYDRSGMNVNAVIRDIEQNGINSANGVIAVSEYTKKLIQKYYGTTESKIHVVHNGIYPKEVRERYRKESGINSKAVLFLGRVTFQKGPDYLVEAASKVIKHIPDVLFILAGSGDMLPKLIERVHELNIEANFLFPGFLKGEAVDRAFSSADLYVMPSVSEPFGISALEAINGNIPVVISKQSGVSEVVAHALKFDFWDVNKFADLMINSLIHKELREDMVSMAKEEIKKIKWDAAATKTIEVYNSYL
jgi:glycosyltransferase involved in cell wall biosynthesis